MKIVLEVIDNPDGSVQVKSSMSFKEMKERFVGKDLRFTPAQAYAMEMMVAAASMSKRGKEKFGITRIPLILPS